MFVSLSWMMDVLAFAATLSRPTVRHVAAGATTPTHTKLGWELPPLLLLEAYFATKEQSSNPEISTLQARPHRGQVINHNEFEYSALQPLKDEIHVLFATSMMVSLCDKRMFYQSQCGV